MANQCVVAEIESAQQVQQALEVLETDGFTREEVSVVTSAEDPLMKEIRERSRTEEADSPPAKGAIGVGAFTGGALGGAIGFATMVGPLMIAGPLAGIAAGAAMGAVLSGTKQWGVDEKAAAELEQRVQNGSHLVIVSGDDTIRVGDAARLLKTVDHRSIERYQLD